jgi:cyanophycinase
MSNASPRPSPGPIALVGSGEFLAQMEDVDRHLLDGRPARAVFLPTAAGEEGDRSIDHWLDLGRRHYERLGVEAVALRVVDRADADRADLAALVAGAGLVYLSGGNPGYLARTLHDTLVWRAIMAAWQAGAALAGCSAGAGALTALAPDVRNGSATMQAGLGVVDHLAVIPHFDRMMAWDAQFDERFRSVLGPGVTLVGVDEDTALVGGPDRWTVMGRQRVTVFARDGERLAVEAGTELELPPPA